MDKTRIDYDYDKKTSVRHSNDPALDRELREYNKNEAVEFMRRKKALRELSNEEKIEQISDERNKKINNYGI